MSIKNFCVFKISKNDFNKQTVNYYQRDINLALSIEFDNNTLVQDLLNF